MSNLIENLLENLYFHLDPNFYFSEKAENQNFFEKLEFSKMPRFFKIILITSFLTIENIKYKIEKLAK